MFQEKVSYVFIHEAGGYPRSVNFMGKYDQELNVLLESEVIGLTCLGMPITMSGMGRASTSKARTCVCQPNANVKFSKSVIYRWIGRTKVHKLIQDQLVQHTHMHRTTTTEGQ